MNINSKSLHLGENRKVPVKMLPAGLNHPDFFLIEPGHSPFQEIRRRKKISIEYRDQTSRCLLKTILQSARFVSLAVSPVYDLDVTSLRLQLCSDGPGDFSCFVGRVIQYLN